MFFKKIQNISISEVVRLVWLHGPTGLGIKMNVIHILNEDLLQILVKYQLCSFSQKLISQFKIT